ncbi:hypothetical protein BH11ARM2_BH11ARM2_21820 [soil metagenome]
MGAERSTELILRHFLSFDLVGQALAGFFEHIGDVSEIFQGAVIRVGDIIVFGGGIEGAHEADLFGFGIAHPPHIAQIHAVHHDDEVETVEVLGFELATDHVHPASVGEADLAGTEIGVMTDMPASGARRVDLHVEPPFLRDASEDALGERASADVSQTDEKDAGRHSIIVGFRGRETFARKLYMLGDLFNLFEAGGCLLDLLGGAFEGTGSHAPTASKKGQSDRLKRVLKDAKLFENIEDGKGTIAYEPTLQRFGYAVKDEVATFFGGEDIARVRLSPASSFTVLVTVREGTRERVHELRFETRTLADRWCRHMEERLSQTDGSPVRSFF